VALNANALTTLDRCKAQLEIPLADTSQDFLLEIYINSASNMIPRYCNRNFVETVRTDLLDGTGKSEILLPGRPAHAPTSCRVDSSRVFDAETELAAGTFAIVGGATLRRHTGVWPRGSQNVRLSYSEGFAAIPSDVELACILLAEWLFRRQQDRRSGRMSVSKGGESTSYDDNWPPVAKDLLAQWQLPADLGVGVRG
jgi:hypothetical protein